MVSLLVARFAASRFALGEGGAGYFGANAVAG